MEIITTIVGQGFSEDMYEKLRQGVNWDDEPVDGWIAHVVYFDEAGGIHMTNIWESAQHMQVAFANRFGPVMRRIGIPPPYVEVNEIFNLSVFQATG